MQAAMAHDISQVHQCMCMCMYWQIFRCTDKKVCAPVHLAKSSSGRIATAQASNVQPKSLADNQKLQSGCLWNKLFFSSSFYRYTRYGYIVIRTLGTFVSAYKNQISLKLLLCLLYILIREIIDSHIYRGSQNHCESRFLPCNWKPQGDPIGG